MKRIVMVTVVGILLLLAAVAFARGPKNDYQFTGPVLEVDDDHLVVQKGKEKWEFAIDNNTEMAIPVKVGDKVTVKYLMKATSVEPKIEAGKPAKKK